MTYTVRLPSANIIGITVIAANTKLRLPQVGGQLKKAYGTACRMPDGQWKIVN